MGETLLLRYRVVAEDGGLSTALLQELSSDKVQSDWLPRGKAANNKKIFLSWADFRTQ